MRHPHPVDRAADDTFAEQHRQYFRTGAQVPDALLDAGFAVTALTEEYSHRPARCLNAAQPGRPGVARMTPRATGERRS
jgi:hypothetical protein